MRFLVLVLVLMVALCSAELPYVTKHFTQQLDHFSFYEERTFSQRYLISTAHWNGTGPMVFYTGNEGDIAWFWNNTGFAPVLAQELGAVLVFAEHRYYGETLPFGNDSFSRENLRFFTSEQALADYAELVRFLSTDLRQDGQRLKVAAIGGSYGGMLAAWFRTKYPTVVDVALAASAPVLQFMGTGFDYSAFYKIATNDFARTHASCPDIVREGYKHLMSIPDGAESEAIYRRFNFCKVLSSTAPLVDWVTNGLTYMAMTDYPYPTSFLEPMPGWPVKVACDRLVQSAASPLDSLMNAAMVYYNGTGTATGCFSVEQSGSDNLGVQGWNYQACTEMVMPTTSTFEADMFPPQPFDPTTYAQGCREQFGVTPRPTWVPLHYFDETLAGVSNVIFSNGDLDPWMGGGVTTNVTSDIVAFIIEEGAHHLDLRAPNPADPPSVQWVRQAEINYIREKLHNAK